MKHRSFTRIWAPLVVALMFVAAILVAHRTLDAKEKAKAVSELNDLLDMVAARATVDADALAMLGRAADEAAIHKARTVMRFLEHDDTLLATDALGVLAELLDVRAIAVVNDLGVVTAASDESLIGADYASDETMAWVMPFLADGAIPGTMGSGIERAAVAQRADTDGLVVVWTADALATELISQADVHEAAQNLAVTPNKIKIVNTVGEDGVFEQDNMLYVQRAMSGVTAIAWRPLAAVHAVQNAILTCLFACAVLNVLTLSLGQAFSAPRRPPQAPEEDEPAPDEPLPEERFSDSVMMEAMEEEAWARKAPRRQKPEPRPKRRSRLFEVVEEPDEEDEADDDEFGEAPPPRRPRRKQPRSGAPEQGEEPSGFDKIFE